MPSVGLGAALLQSPAHPKFRHPRHTVLREEKAVHRTAENFRFPEAEEALCARVPTGDPAHEVEGEDRDFSRAPEDAAQMLRTVARRGVGLDQFRVFRQHFTFQIRVGAGEPGAGAPDAWFVAPGTMRLRPWLQ